MSEMSIQNTNTDLEKLKAKIETMNKQHHIEVLKILKKHPNVKLNENKSGVFVNLSFLSKEVIDEIMTYTNYICDQESSIRNLEEQQDNYKNAFFVDTNENTVLYNSVR